MKSYEQRRCRRPPHSRQISMNCLVAVVLAPSRFAMPRGPGRKRGDKQRSSTLPGSRTAFVAGTLRNHGSSRSSGVPSGCLPPKVAIIHWVTRASVEQPRRQRQLFCDLSACHALLNGLHRQISSEPRWHCTTSGGESVRAHASPR
jgi:hypothetical protein